MCFSNTGLKGKEIRPAWWRSVAVHGKWTQEIFRRQNPLDLWWIGTWALPRGDRHKDSGRGHGQDLVTQHLISQEPASFLDLQVSALD